MPGTEIHRDAARSRYVLLVDGDPVGVADYQVRGDDIVFTHTEVDPAHRHRGLGDRLIEHALDDARRRFGAHIVPACPFVADFIAAHPDYEELLVSH